MLRIGVPIAVDMVFGGDFLGALVGSPWFVGWPALEVIMAC